MKVADKIKATWLSTRELPALARWGIRYGMTACPILTVVLMLLWLLSLPFLPGAVWMTFLAVGSWGVAARRPNYRWILVFSTFAAEAVSLLNVPLRFFDIASAGWWSLVLYIALFQARTIPTYFGETHSKSINDGRNAS